MVLQLARLRRRCRGPLKGTKKWRGGAAPKGEQAGVIRPSEDRLSDSSVSALEFASVKRTSVNAVATASAAPSFVLSLRRSLSCKVVGAYCSPIRRALQSSESLSAFPASGRVADTARGHFVTRGVAAADAGARRHSTAAMALASSQAPSAAAGPIKVNLAPSWAARQARQPRCLSAGAGPTEC